MNHLKGGMLRRDVFLQNLKAISSRIILRHNLQVLLYTLHFYCAPCLKTLKTGEICCLYHVSSLPLLSFQSFLVKGRQYMILNKNIFCCSSLFTLYCHFNDSKVQKGKKIHSFHNQKFICCFFSPNVFYRWRKEE